MSGLGQIIVALEDGKPVAFKRIEPDEAAIPAAKRMSKPGRTVMVGNVYWIRDGDE